MTLPVLTVLLFDCVRLAEGREKMFQLLDSVYWIACYVEQALFNISGPLFIVSGVFTLYCAI